jgi:hypothetical protein
MSAAKKLPKGLQFNKGKTNEQPALKRKRQSTGGGFVVTAISYSGTSETTAAESTASTPPGPQFPAKWLRIFNEIEAAGGTVPPESVCVGFVELHSRCLEGFKSALRALQRAVTTNDKFTLSASTGSVPTSVRNAVKLPYVQVMKLATGVENDQVVTAHKTAAENALSSAAVESTKYLTALYTAQVAAIREKVKVAAVADEFATSLKEYSASVMADAAVTDTTMWDPLIARLKTAVASELETAQIDFVATLRREADAKEAKATLVNTARADAEMTDGTRPVEEVIEEKIAVHFDSACLPRSHPSLLHADPSPFHFCSPRVREEAYEADSAGDLNERDIRSLEDLDPQTQARLVQWDIGEGDGEESQGFEEGFGQVQLAESRQGQERRRRGQRARPQRKRRHQAEEEEAQGGEGRGAGQRLGLNPTRPLRNVISSWVSPSGTRFHHRRPDTYPEEFFAASPSVRTRFVTSKMTDLYYDTRLRNRAFHNFTPVSLSHEQVKTLALNQKFVPKPKAARPDSTLDAVEDFTRRLRLRVDKSVNDATLHAHFGEATERGQPRYVPRFHVPNPFAQGPPLLDKIESALSKFRDKIEVEVLSRQTLRIQPNINHDELKALLELLAENSVLAVPADKNLGLCLVTSDWYHSMGMKLLVNDSYVEDEPDHFLQLLTLRKIVHRARTYVTRQQHDWLNQPCVEEPSKVPILKVLPKIHKLPISGRPIVPTFGTLFANASVWVDYQLKPLLDKFPWILRDSKTFCHDILSVDLPRGEDIWLVTGDVVAMYPNIPMDDGISRIASILETSLMEFDTLEEAACLQFNGWKELLVLLLRLILKFNYVSFGDKTFRQVIGTAMGTSCAPTYANLFLASFEGPALADFKEHILFYRRFIDDTFAIIKGSLEDVLQFQRRFGSLHPNMRMEWTQSQRALPFLDIQVSLELDPRKPAFNPQKRIKTNVYQKALNAYLYIPWNSCHSVASKRAWVKGELIRYVRICSSESDFANIRKEFAIRLSARGYPGRWLRSVFEEVNYTAERPNALEPSINTDGSPDVHVLKLTHNPVWEDVDLTPIWHDLGEAWKEFGHGYPEFDFMASYKKPVALGDQLNIHNRSTLEAYHARLALNV